MIQDTTIAEPIVPESLPTPAGCQLCRQRRDDLIAAALTWFDAHGRRSDDEPGDTDEQIKHKIRHEIIEGKPRRYCEDCGKRIPPYHSMQNCGFQSHTHHHHHADPDDRLGCTFQIPVHRELCYECYRADHQLAYPNEPLPNIANARFD